MSKLNLAYNYAMAFVGVHYSWGGSNPLQGFDCSGLVQEILASIGMDPPGDQTAQTLYDHFLSKGIASQNGLGALGFYGSSTSSITHVVFMLNEESAIGANGGWSNTLTAQDAAKSNAFVKIRHINYRKDLVAVVMPNYGS